MADGQMSGGAQGPFALIQPWLSGESAQDKLRDYYNRQAQANAGAVAGDPNAPFSGEFATPPGQPAKPLPMGQAPPGPNEPQSTQTPESYGSLLMDLQQQNEAAAGFNKSLAVGLSAFSQPRDREMVSKMFDPAVPPADPFKMGESIMNSMSMQQGQDRSNQIARLVNGPQGPDIASKLNMSVEALRAGLVTDPGLPAKIAQALGTPTDQMRNLTQIDQYISGVQQRDPGKTPAVLTMIKNAMLAGMAGPAAEAAIGDAVSYKNRTGKDAPWVVNGAIDQGAYKQFQANQAQKESDRGDASKVLADNQNTSEELRSNLEQLRDMPGLKTILADPVKRAAASKALNPAVDLPSLVAQNVLTNDEAAAVATLRKIGGASSETAMRSMAGTGTRVTQQEVGPLKDAISSTMNLNQDYDTYVHNAINPFVTKIKKTIANAYGATGNLNHMDPEYEPWLHPIYRKGGELFKEGSGAENIPDLQPLTPGKLAWAKNEVTNYPAGKDDALDSLQQEGFDVSKLRKSDPSTW